MLNFATEFPVAPESTRTDFISVVKNWILGSPHTTLLQNDLDGMFPDGEFVVERGGQRIVALGIDTPDGQMFAVRNITWEGDLEWDTAVVFSRNENDSWVGIRTARDSLQTAVRLPAARKPLIVKKILDALGGDVDGSVRVSAEPFRLTENSIALAANLITGDAACNLPIVYVSIGFDGKYHLDAEALANDLAGMAHVVLEPDRKFSRQLQSKVSSQNVYGGAVGIYWPNGTGRRVFFAGPQFDNAAELKWAIIDEVRTALLNRRSLYRCTWEAVEDAVRRAAVEKLKASGSTELSAYVATFDAELVAKDARLAQAEKEISRLKSELRGQQSTAAATIGLNLRTGGEQDLYGGEIVEVVLETIHDGVSRLPADSRRGHILSAVMAANPISGVARAKRDQLKELLRDYRRMDSGVRSGLEALGFTIYEEGKHYKLIYQDDPRYTFTLAKTGSDHRGGLNSASDIAKHIF
jgi:hypothetical protein